MLQFFHANLILFDGSDLPSILHEDTHKCRLRSWRRADIENIFIYFWLE